MICCEKEFIVKELQRMLKVKNIMENHKCREILSFPMLR